MKPNIYFYYAIILGAVFLFVTFWVQLLLNPQIDTTGAANASAIIIHSWLGDTISAKIAIQTVPSIINGITASTSIIIAFSGAVIGIMFRDVFKNDRKARTFLLVVIFYFALPLMYQFVVYTFLIMGFLDWALRWALDGFLLSMMIFMFAMLSVFHRLGLGKETEPDNSELDKPKPDENKTTEKNKNVNVFVNVNNQ